MERTVERTVERIGGNEKGNGGDAKLDVSGAVPGSIRLLLGHDTAQDGEVAVCPLVAFARDSDAQATRDAAAGEGGNIKGPDDQEGRRETAVPSDRQDSKGHAEDDSAGGRDDGNASKRSKVTMASQAKPQPPPASICDTSERGSKNKQLWPKVPKSLLRPIGPFAKRGRKERERGGREGRDSDTNRDTEGRCTHRLHGYSCACTCTHAFFLSIPLYPSISRRSDSTIWDDTRR